MEPGESEIGRVGLNNTLKVDIIPLLDIISLEI